MKSLLIFVILASAFERILSNPPNFNYDFSGLHKLTGLLPTNCNDIEGQVIFFSSHHLLLTMYCFCMWIITLKLLGDSSPCPMRQYNYQIAIRPSPLFSWVGLYSCRGFFSIWTNCRTQAIITLLFFPVSYHNHLSLCQSIPIRA